MSKVNPAKFVREVRLEMEKVSWPSRRETLISTGMVLAMVAVTATFFVFVDWVISTLIRLVLGIA